MTIEIITRSQPSPPMSDLVNVSLGLFLWKHVKRLYELYAGEEDVDATRVKCKRVFTTNPLKTDGIQLKFEGLTERQAELFKDYRNILAMYFKVSEEDIVGATLLRYSPTDRPTLYDNPANWSGDCPTVETAFLPVRDFYQKQAGLTPSTLFN